MQKVNHQVYLGLGANLGNREETILAAYKEIERLVGVIVRRSAFYYSEPWGFESSHPFVNTVILVETPLSPKQLLRRTQQIERRLGKTRRHATDRKIIQHSTFNIQHSSYHDRPIDIDILLYDDLVIDTPELKIPHPLMQERDFVMVPLKEIL